MTTAQYGYELHMGNLQLVPSFPACGQRRDPFPACMSDMELAWQVAPLTSIPQYISLSPSEPTPVKA